MREDIMLKLGQWANRGNLAYTCPKCGKTLDKLSTVMTSNYCAFDWRSE